MPVTVTCGCSKSFTLKDEFEGRVVKCPGCGGSVRVRATATSVASAPAAAPSLTPDSELDPIFGRDVFLLHRRAGSAHRQLGAPRRAARRGGGGAGDAAAGGARGLEFSHVRYPFA